MSAKAAPATTRITELSYRRNRSLGNYEHAHLEARITVAPGDDPDKAMERLRSWVERQLGIAKKRFEADPSGGRYVDLDSEEF